MRLFPGGCEWNPAGQVLNGAFLDSSNSILRRGLLLAASDAATSAATAARHGFSFDPAGTLGWSVPVLLLLPIAGFVLLTSGVRSRRAALNIGFLTLGLMLADALLVTWGRWSKPGSYRAAYSWINLPVAFSGPAQFQGFGIDISLAAAHLALAALAVCLAVLLAVLAWHRTAGRGEPGIVRYPAVWLMYALAAVGLVLSDDLGMLIAFWALAGVASYLILNNRWGVEASTRPARLALAVPFAADLSLLAGVAILYSRYGSLQVSVIASSIGHTPGAGLKSLTVACALILVAAFGRAGLFPFSAWLSATVESAPTGVALMQGTWPVFASLLLVKTMPVLLGAGPQAFRFGAWFCLVAVVAGPVLSFLGNDIRRSAVLAASGVSGLGLLALWQPGSLDSGVAAVLASSLGRACLVLSVFALGAAVRSWDLADFGEALRRTPLAAYGAGLGAFVTTFALAAVPGSFQDGSSGSLRTWIFAVGLVLVAPAAWRGFAVAAFSPLRRRRAFEPARVRDVAPAAGWAALSLGLLGGVGIALAFLTRWLAWLDAAGRNPGVSGAAALWLLVPLAAGAIGLGAFALRAPRLLALSSRLGELTGGWWLGLLGLYDAYLWRPLVRAVWGFETGGLNRGEAALGPALVRSGAALGRLPAVQLLGGAAVLAALAGVAAGLAGGSR